jgi:hypothetical protein
MTDMTLQTVVRFSGRAAWGESLLADHLKDEIVEAIVRGDEISLVWPRIDGEHSQMTLKKRSDRGEYSGRGIWASGTPFEDVAEIQAVLYSNSGGHVILGEEKWKSGKVDWFVVQLTTNRS